MANVVRKEIHNHPKTAILKAILLITLLIPFIDSIILHNWVITLLSFIMAILICLPMYIEKWAHISIPARLKVYIILFLYAAIFLGELKSYYTTFWWWDVLLHTTSGLAFGIIGFIILYVLYKTEKIKTSPKIVAMFSFAFALAIGAIWEIVEFTIDHTLGPAFNITPMQTVVNNCGLIDTMKDLIVDSVGALFSALMGYLYLKRDSGIIVKPMVKEFKKDNPRLFKKKNR